MPMAMAATTMNAPMSGSSSSSMPTNTTAMPIGQKMVWPRKIVLVIGEPIYPDVPLEGRVPRATVDATTERIRVAVQALYEDAQHRAGTTP